MVTTRHVAEKLEGRRFYVRVNKRSGEMETIEFGPETKWWYHPRDKRCVDSAATLFFRDIYPDLDVETIRLEMFTNDQIIREHNLGIGDEVFIAGLFMQTSETTKNIPIVRMGTVVMIPGEKLPFRGGLIEAYLVECRSIDGLSGSPVFIRETIQIQSCIPFKTGKFPNETFDSYSNESVEIEALHGVGKLYFFGSIVGHWDLEHFSAVHAGAVNMGISPVVPAQRTKEVILQDGLIELMKARSERFIEQSKACATYD
jgi:hypothetical protein